MFGPIKKPSRIGQWDGRRRSSRSDALVWSQLISRAVLLRLGVVLLTAIIATYLAYHWGGPQGHRIGEVRGYDLRARVYFEMVDQDLTDRLRDELEEKLPVEIRRNRMACEEARQA